MSENEVIQNDDLRLYELGVNIIASLEDKIQAEFETIKETIKNKGGEIVAESVPVTIPLAYTMTKNIDSKNQKHNNASFGWVKFNATPDKIELIKEELDLNANILRYVVLKTTTESNTTSEAVAEALSKKAETEGKSRKSKSEDAEVEEVEDVEDVEEVVSTDEVDEAIEELVEEDK